MGGGWFGSCGGVFQLVSWACIQIDAKGCENSGSWFLHSVGAIESVSFENGSGAQVPEGRIERLSLRREVQDVLAKAIAQGERSSPVPISCM